MKKLFKTGIVLSVVLLAMASMLQAGNVTLSWEYPYDCYESPAWCSLDGFRMYWGEDRDGPYPNLLFDVDKEVLECNSTLGDVHEYFLIMRAYAGSEESDDSDMIHWYKNNAITVARSMFSGQASTSGGFVR